MTTRLYKLFPHLTVLFLFGIYCTTVNTTGVTDMPNEKVSGLLVYKSDLRRASCSVVLRKILLTATGDSIVYEKQTNPDGLGRYTFDNIENGTYIVYSHDMVTGMAAVISKLQKSSGSATGQDLFLDRTITIKGRILSDSSSAKAVRVFIPGLGIHSDIDASGFYQLDNVPNGQYDLGFVYDNGLNFLSVKTTANTDTVFIRDAQIGGNSGRIYNFFDSRTGTAWSIDPLIYAQNPDWYTGKDFFAASYYTIENNNLVEVDETGQTALLLDNFNDSDAFTELFKVFPDIIWYGWDDQSVGGTTVILPDIIGQPGFSRCIEPVDGMGMAAHVRFIFGNGIEYPYAGIGCKNKTTEMYYINLEKMTAISFYLKGKGSVKVAFSSKKVDDYPEEDQWGDLQKTIKIPSEWQKITIPTNELTPPPYSVQLEDDLKWEDVRDSIRSIHFESVAGDEYSDTTELWIDNIFMHGIGSFNLK